MMEQYVKNINIEALTMIDMARHSIMPAAMDYAKTVADSIASVSAVSAKLNVTAQKEVLEEVCDRLAAMNKKTAELAEAVEKASGIADVTKQAETFRAKVFAKMQEMRAEADALEKIIAAKHWPLPTYAEMLFVL